MHPPEPQPDPRRLASIDAYRGLVMLLMMAEALHLCAVARARPESRFWRLLCSHQTHVEWVGCSVHDLIQPSFSFLVGVALPFSLASRSVRGQSRARMTAHALGRALALVLLGIFLRSIGHERTHFTFEDTLTQIGLGYPFLFALGFRPARDRWIALAVVLGGYWAAFALAPLPGPGFDSARVGVPEGWPHVLGGFAAHWNKNSNPAWAFDTWFLNLFPRERPFVFNRGGYATLSFVPTLGTMILGLIAGDVLRDGRPAGAKLRWLVVAGVVALLAGWAAGALGICPVVKRIWTPSWVLFSGGWCFLLMAASAAVLDGPGRGGWALPLVVVWRNSIAAYCMSHLFEGFLAENLKVHLGRDAFRILGPAYEPLLHGAAVLLVLWLILFWMYRRGLFLRI